MQPPSNTGGAMRREIQRKLGIGAAFAALLGLGAAAAAVTASAAPSRGQQPVSRRVTTGTARTGATGTAPMTKATPTTAATDTTTPGETTTTPEEGGGS